MGLIELFIIAVGLSMDAFAVAVCKGLSMWKINFRKMIVVGLYFGIFQAIMPLVGYIAGFQFSDKITAFDHWIAFAFLGFIGAKMINDSFEKKSDSGISENRRQNKNEEASLDPKKMLPLALATSIDALAIGISFAFLNVSIIPAVLFIGIITFVLSVVGVKIGNVFGEKYKSKAEFVGGAILILMGIKILLEHLSII